MLTVAGWLGVIAPVHAIGSLASVEVIDRRDGRVLPVYSRDGSHWIEGIPGHEYAIRLRNNGSGRLLAVTSVDGVNVISGDTAAPSQTGYVLDHHGSMEIGGWRKSFAQTAAFYFTELPDAYAARTGRPDNIGVIGVALFREKSAPIAIAKPRARIAENAARDSAEPPASAGSAGANESASPHELARAEAKSEDRRDAAPMRSLAPQIGTGHGRIESSRAQRVDFERDSPFAAETLVIRYDRRENLAAMGILAPPVFAQRPDPFPGAVRFTPDPPSR